MTVLGPLVVTLVESERGVSSATSLAILGVVVATLALSIAVFIFAGQ